MEENNSNKMKISIIISSVLLVVALVVGVSYAYFSSISTSATKTVTTGKLSLTFDDSTAIINASNISPIARESILTKAVKKEFTITNTSSDKVFVDITLTNMNLPEALERYDFMWSLYEEDTNISNGSFNGGYINEDNEVKVGEYQVFDKGEEKTYNLYIWIEETSLDQSDMMNKIFNAKIEASAISYYTSPEEDFVFDSTTGTITGYLGTDTDIIIPSTINGVDVTSIGDYAFYDRTNDVGVGLTSVVIPNSVTSIGKSAFRVNNLTSITIPNSVTSISSHVFYGNKLNHAVIPNSVTSIGTYAFHYNEITSVVIPNNIAVLSNYVFCKNKISGIIIPNNITSIELAALADNQLTNIVVPNSVTTIGESAFKTNQLTSAIIGNNVNTIGNAAFSQNNDLTEIKVLGKNDASEFTSLGTSWNGTCTNIIYDNN